MPLSTTRAVAVGWLVVLALLALFVFLGLLRFLVFLLFMRLVVDLLVHGLGNRVPFLSRQVVLYGVYALVAGVIAVLAVVVVPRFLVDLPAYGRSLDANLGGKIAGQLASWNIAIDVGDLKLKAVEWGRGHLGQSFDLAKRAGTNVVLLVVISLINTGLTLGLLVVLGIPHKAALTVMVFVFGLLPIIGNLISNTLICLSAFLWAGLVQVVAALAFLIVIHKLEYFLNGKIIGNVVKLPMYLTLLGLIVGEALFGISGMILSIPTILFVRAELGAIKVAPTGSGERV